MSHLVSSKKRSFILKNIDVVAVNHKYGLVIMSNIDRQKEEPIKSTKITDVIYEAEPFVSFLDENKKKYNAVVTMMECLHQKHLPVSTSVKCFWCKHSFTSNPIGCPIKYVNSKIEKSYISHITKDKYYMKENITNKKLKTISSLISHNENIEISPVEHDYYLTDGIFCSFNCAMSFIRDNSHDSFYKESYSLLYAMYFDFVGKKPDRIVPAPHWRLLSDFGGTLSIYEFRKSFQMVSYEFLYNIRDIIDMKPMSKVFKEKVTE